MTGIVEPTQSEPASPDPGYAKAVAAGTGWITGQAIVNKLATAVAMYVVAQRLSEEAMGMATLSLNVGVFLTVFPPFVMGDVLIAHQRRFSRVAPLGRKMVMRAGVAMTVAIALLAPAVAFLYSDFQWGVLVGLLLALSIRPTAEAASVLSLSKLRTKLRYRAIAFVDGGTQLAGTVATVALALSGAGAMSLVIPQMVVVIARSACYALAVRAAEKDAPVLTHAPRARGDTALRRRLRGDFATGSMAQYVHNAVFALPALLLGYFSSKTETGIFGFSFMLATQATAVIGSQLGTVLQPVFSHLHGDPARQAAAYLRVTRAISAIAVPLSLLQFALAAPLFALLFSPKWDSALGVFMVLSVGQCFYFGISPTIALLKAQGRFRAYFGWQIVHFAIAATTYSIAAHRGGAFAVSVADLAIWGASAPIAMWLATRASGHSPLTALGVYLAPWATALPIALLALGAWRLLQPYALAGQLMSLLIVGPLALLASIWAMRFSQPATYAELRPFMFRAFTGLGRIPSRAFRLIGGSARA